MFFHSFSGARRIERELIRERPQAELTAARERECKPAMNEEQIKQARAMMDDPKLKIKSIIKALGISKATLYKYVPMGKPTNEKKK